MFFICLFYILQSTLVIASLDFVFAIWSISSKDVPYFLFVFYTSQVQEVLDEMGHSSIPLSIISKAAEIQLLDVVDKVLLGNKWLRKATGIQPKFPYLVDSFEERFVAFYTSINCLYFVLYLKFYLVSWEGLDCLCSR